MGKSLHKVHTVDFVFISIEKKEKLKVHFGVCGICGFDIDDFVFQRFIIVGM